MSVIGWEWYDGYDPIKQSSKDVRYLRLGRDRWRIEIGERGFYLRLGRLELTSYFRLKGEPEDG